MPPRQSKSSEAGPHMNLDLHRVVRYRAQTLALAGDTDAARQELRALRSDLEQRGVNEVVLDDIAAEEELAN